MPRRVVKEILQGEGGFHINTLGLTRFRQGYEDIKLEMMATLIAKRKTNANDDCLLAVA